MLLAVLVPRRSALIGALSLLAACSPAGTREVPAAERAAIADTLRSLLVGAYDLSKPGDAVARLMSLYPDSGRVVSASGGQVSTSRDSLKAELAAFWENVGRNMRNPKWTWGQMHVDVLAPDAAVLTTTYSVPHLTPAGQPHVIAGAWTAVFQRRAGRWVIVQEHLSDLPPTPTVQATADTAAAMPMEHHH
jgi:ketosteroid isomerase-like protein